MGEDEDGATSRSLEHVVYQEKHAFGADRAGKNLLCSAYIRCRLSPDPNMVTKIPFSFFPPANTTPGSRCESRSCCAYGVLTSSFTRTVTINFDLRTGHRRVRARESEWIFFMWH